MKTASAKAPEWPKIIRNGSVILKIYRVENKGRESFTLSYHAAGKRVLKMFASLDEAVAEGKAKATTLANGELDALHLRAEDARVYVYCAQMARSAGIPLDLLVKDAVEAVKVVDGKVSLLEMAKEFKRRKMHELPDKMLPVAVDEMIETRTKDGTGDAYVRVLKVYLNQLKESFNCQLRAVTTGQLADYLRNQDVSSRSKNNARATIGAFFKFCKERGWLPRDHEGIELVPKFKEKPTDITIYSSWEVTQFLNHSRPEMVPFLAIGAFAGLRSAEIERLDWSEVHLADKFIEIKAAKAKTASRLIVPISTNLAKWLKDHSKDEGRVMPFDNVNKQIGWLVEDTNQALKEAAEKDGKDPDKAKKVQWKKNALRHSFISYRVAETQDVAKVALEAGNSPQIIFQHYRELVQPKEAKAWFVIKPAPAK
ncbi:MAG TPA: tyrosine-type recombinase/integrase [Candidatus Angelobacter sp.]|nr:tyrosine-type recombinase/integrase [Candidatus Angelobacter sp.]